MGTEYDSKQPSPTRTDLQSGHPTRHDFAVSASGDLAEQAADIRPAKHTAIPQNPDIPAHLQMNTSLPWNAPNGDIHIRLVNNPNGRGSHWETNVAWSVFKGSTGGFATGQLADGADELALNILNQFVPPGADGYAPQRFTSPHWAEHVVSVASRTAHLLESDFRCEFIYSMGPNGGTINGEKIRQWIDENNHIIHNRHAR